jgi:hypothetical protein
MDIIPDCLDFSFLAGASGFFLNRRFFHKSYLPLRAESELREGRMEEDRLVSISQVTCDHWKQRLYKQTRFDILNGFELVLTRCINCHKILAFEVKKLK